MSSTTKYYRLLVGLAISFALTSGCATFGQNLTNVREFFSPGSDAFKRGQVHSERREYQQALSAFEEAAKKAPDNSDYKAAISETRSLIVASEISRAGQLPKAAIRERLRILHDVRPFDDSSPSKVEQEISERELRLHEVTAAAERVRKLAATDAVQALEALIGLLDYDPYVAEVAAAKQDVLSRRAQLFRHAVAQFHSGAFERAAAHIQRLSKVARDEELISLEKQVTLARWKRLVEFGRKAEESNLPATALQYYTDARALAPELESLSEKVSRLRDHLSALTSRQVRILFSDALSREHRARILELLSGEVKSVGSSLDEIIGRVAKDTEFVTEVELLDFQWESKPDEPETVWSSFLAGYQKAPSPDYTSALLNYQQAANSYNSFVLQQNPFGQLLAAIEMGKWRRKLEETPQYNEEPVYQPYQYTKRIWREGGRVALRVALVDVPGNRDYVSEEIVEKEQNTEAEVAGAHPQDRDAVRNRRYSREESVERQEGMKNRAFTAVARKLAGYVIAADRHRADDYFGLGGLREGVEAMLRYSYVASKSPAVESSELVKTVEDIKARYLGEGPLGPSPEEVMKGRSSRALPSITLTARKVAQPREMVRTAVTLVELTPEEIVKRASPAVVTVRTFMAQGSGFVVHPRGVVLTNAHVVEGARDIAVHIADGRRFLASVVAKDPRRDIAVLKIEGDGLPALRLRLGDKPVAGESVLAMGAPAGLQQTVTRGIVSAVRRLAEAGKELNLDPDLELIQTDAAINPGNSGGPLLDKFGRVVGMNTLKRGGEGLGFAIASSELTRVLQGVLPEAK